MTSSLASFQTSDTRSGFALLLRHPSAIRSRRPDSGARPPLVSLRSPRRSAGPDSDLPFRSTTHTLGRPTLLLLKTMPLFPSSYTPRFPLPSRFPAQLAAVSGRAEELLGRKEDGKNGRSIFGGMRW